MDRGQSIARLEAESFDIVVIGGGATGLGTAVDAASRGFRVALLEQADFAKATSSRSTKLVHGGVRYLRQGNVSLVLEALKERGRLCQNAAHLAHNMAFVIPSYSWWEGPFYGIGMKVYDRLAGKLGLQPSRSLSREETIEQIPTVETEGLTGGVIYHDGQFDDSRLAINLAETASTLGGVVANYVKVTALLKRNGFVSGVRALDLESGREFEVEAKAVVNATGIFVDQVRKMDDAASPNVVAPSQGVHIVLPKRFLPGGAAIMIPKTADGRVLFAVPWHGCVVVGTTDTAVPRAELEPRSLDEERHFLMEHARRYLTEDPGDEDVLSIFAGQRPLVRSDDASNTAALSRDHTILVSESGLITVTGGKWTTYRKMAEDVVDHAELVGGLDPARCETAGLRIHGWTRDHIAEEHLQVYGSDAASIKGVMAERPELATPLHPLLPYQKAEVVWHVQEEMARTVEDVLARRTRALLLNAEAAIEASEEVGKLMASELGKDDQWAAESAADFRVIARGHVFSDPASRAR